MKYPDAYVGVDLSGPGGNAFAIMASVKRALKEIDVPKIEIDECLIEMMAGDYEHLLDTASKWVDFDRYGG